MAMVLGWFVSLYSIIKFLNFSWRNTLDLKMEETWHLLEVFFSTVYILHVSTKSKIFEKVKFFTLFNLPYSPAFTSMLKDKKPPILMKVQVVSYLTICWMLFGDYSTICCYIWNLRRNYDVLSKTEKAQNIYIIITHLQ